MGTLTIDIRRAGVEDAEAVAAVHLDAWKYAYNGLIPYSALDRMVSRRGEEWWARAISRKTVVLVIEIECEIVGYLTLGRNRVETLPVAGEIYELYLRPEFQGVGLGTRLFLNGRAELKRRGLRGVVVWVLADNDQAISFYENSGGNLVAEGNETFDGKVLRKLAYAWDF